MFVLLIVCKPERLFPASIDSENPTPADLPKRKARDLPEHTTNKEKQLKKAFISIMLVIVMLISCTAEIPLTGEGSVSVTIDDSALLLGDTLVADSYKVSVKNVDKGVTYPELKLDGGRKSVDLTVATGNVEVSVAALDAEGKVVAAGSATAVVKEAEKTALTVKMQPKLVLLRGITLDKTSISFTSEPDKDSFIVTKTTNDTTYDVSTEASWITVSKTSTEGLKDTWTVTVTANDTTYERTAVITVGTKTLTVNQEGKKSQKPEVIRGIIIDKTEISFGAESGTEKFIVTRTTDDTEYAVKADADWITVTNKATEGLKDTWTFSVTANDTTAERTAEITVGTKKVTVNQEGKKAPKPELIRGITLDKTSISFTADAGNKSFTVTKTTADTTYEVKTDADWITVEKTPASDLKDTWTVSVTANDSTAERNSVITVGDKTLTVNQKEPPKPATEILSVDPLFINFVESTESEAIITVKRKNGTAWDYSVTGAGDGSWLSIEQVSSTGLEDTWILKAESNNTNSDRTRSINIGSFKINVNQSAAMTGPAKQERVVIDGFTPYWDGESIVIGHEYEIKAHIEPLSASQEWEYKITSRGTGRYQGESNRFVNDGMAKAVFGVDDWNGKTISPVKVDDYWSKDWTLTVTAKGTDISSSMDFKTKVDTVSRIDGLSESRLDLPDHAGKDVEIKVVKATPETKIETYCDSGWISVERTSVSENGLEETYSISIKENMGVNNRDGKVDFISINNTMSFNVSQKGNPEGKAHVEWFYGVKPPKMENVVRKEGTDYVEIYEDLDDPQGWYLVNKSSLSGDEKKMPDENLCWAMSSASAIHWWYEHNSRWIDAWMKMHPEVVNPKDPLLPKMEFTYNPHAEMVKDKSSITPIYIDRHFDYGGFPQTTLRDVLFIPRSTNDKTGVAKDENEKPNKQYPGWL